MTRDEIRQVVLKSLRSVAPEATPATLHPEVSLRDQLDIDSMDFLNFMISLHKEFHVEIPERDYAQLATINGCVSYLAGALSEDTKR